MNAIKQPKRGALKQYGLRPTEPDSRDFQLGQIADLPKLADLPREFIIADLGVRDQGNSDFCSAYMSTAMSEPQEQVVLEPSWSFAKSKEISGDVEQWGQNLRDALKAHTKFGALPSDLSPYSVDTKPTDFLRNIANWPELTNSAYPHRKKSYFKISGPYDAFDNARASMFKFRSVIGSGVNWGWPITQGYLNTIPSGGYGHAVPYLGWTLMENGEEVLILKNSYGEKVGFNGYYYVTREVYNHFSNMYGAYMFVDISPEEAKQQMECGIKWDDHWFLKIVKRIFS